MAVEPDPPAGVPEWIVTYGDMMSLLLTFFIMLVSLSEVDANQQFRAVLESLERQLGYRTSTPAPPGKSFPLNSLIEKLTTLGSFTKGPRGKGGVKAEGPKGEDQRILRTRDGRGIPVGEAIPFAAGTAVLADSKKQELLRTVIPELAGKPNKIEIWGHADPLSKKEGEEASEAFRIGYRRAHAVALFLTEQGIEASRLRILSVGDSEPLPQSGDRISQRNDRVEIYLLDAFKGEYVGPRE